MEHTQIVTALELENYANTRESEAVIPELIWLLVKESVSDLSDCRIPYGDSINQPGWDGRVESASGFRQFVPKNRSYWEIGTGAYPQAKATKDFKVRTRKMSPNDRNMAGYVFVTPYGPGSGGWNEPQQSRWLGRRTKFGWREIKILDAVQLADWLREFPAIGKWLIKRMGLAKNAVGFSTPSEHWENLQQLSRPGDPSLPVDVFLVGRDQARSEVLSLFSGEKKQLVLAIESEHDAEDFVAALLAFLDPNSRSLYTNKCLFLREPDVWLSMSTLKSSHVFVAHPNLDLESTGEQLHLTATKNGHAVVIPVGGGHSRSTAKIVSLRSPSASTLQSTLTKNGFKDDRARELAGAGALSLAALKRHLRGLGDLPPYASWNSSRALSQSGLIGRWSGENAADRVAVEQIVGKTYGEWMEIVRPETLRPDTPLTQRNEKWKLISRGEAWNALGPRLSDDDVDKFQKVVLTVLSEHDPRCEMPPEERMMAAVKGKLLRHSEVLRSGLAETLALLGSRPKALSACSHGKAELTATLIVRALFKDADWITWASLGNHLPLLAEAAPGEFLDAVEVALKDPPNSPFVRLFAQERAGLFGCSYFSGLLWALETVAWDTDLLVRATLLLGELAAIDPGGNWSNRPINSLTEIFLPWYPQTAAPVAKRVTAIETLLHETPAIGWKVTLALLPNMGGTSTGCRKPAWREFIPETWTDGVTNREYWEQVGAYADLAVKFAAADPAKLAELIDHLPELPSPANDRILEHLRSQTVLSMSESERKPLWEALVDLAAKHRKYSTAKWAMPPDHVVRLEDIASKIAPNSLSILYERLFSARDHDLFEEKGNYEEQQNALNQRRQDAVIAILKSASLETLFEFASRVPSPEKVGNALGRTNENVDAALLPSFLGNIAKPLAAFIGGYVWGRYWTRGLDWVDSIAVESWNDEEKAMFFILLPFEFEIWHRADKVLGSSSACYWKSARVNPWGKQEKLVEAVEKLLIHGRPTAAIACLARLVHVKGDFFPALAVRALIDTLAAKDSLEGLDYHDVEEVIKWLQERPDANQDDLFKIEWSYLPMLDRHFEGAPKTLERRLVSDPSFFCEVISLVFRSDKEPPTDQPTSEQQKAIAQNAYRLLHGWKTVPGTSDTGVFNPDAFTTWMTEARRMVTESGHLQIALSQIGQVLPYAPPDPDGLWIHRSIAEVLNAKDTEEMRSGFTCQLRNMRGVYSDTSGQEEQQLANKYRGKADALEQKGFHRIASSVRGVAASYEKEAEIAAQESPFDE